MNTPAYVAVDSIVLGAPPAGTFEDVGQALGAESSWCGADGAGGFVSDGLAFNNSCTDWGGGSYSWNGWAYSNRTDITTSGLGNQFSAYAGSGAGDSSTYGVAYCDSWASVPPTIALTAALPGSTLQSLRVTNTTYAALSMLQGDNFAKKFGGTSGNDPDWFLLTIEGLDAGGASVGTVDFYLADYRFADNALDYVVDDWAEVDVSSLDGATQLCFSLTSSDVGAWGMNTPAYVAVDSIVLGAPAAVGVVGRNDEDLSAPLVVHLASSDTTEATVPASVIIPAGQTSVQFPIHAVDDFLVDGTQAVTITATSSGYLAGIGSLAVEDDDSDVTPPTVVSVSSPKTDGFYGPGTSIPITVTFGEPVFVAGRPAITLETGDVDAVAHYTGGNGTSTLTFQFTVAAGQYNADLDYVDAAALSLGGGLIRDALLNAGVLALAAPGTAGSLSHAKNLVVDGIAPTASITRYSPQQQATSASAVAFLVDFDESTIAPNAADFGAIATGTVHAGSIQVSDANDGDGSTWLVTVHGISGEGTLGLEFAARQAIADLAGNAFDPATGLTGTESFVLDPYSVPLAPPVISADGTIVTLTFARSNGMTYRHGTTYALVNGNYRLLASSTPADAVIRSIVFDAGVAGAGDNRQRSTITRIQITYDRAVSGGTYQVTANPSTTGGTSFHRLFGDSDGDRDVDARDLRACRQAMAARDAALLAMFDYDGDRDVDAADYRQFRLRYGRRLAP